MSVSESPPGAMSNDRARARELAHRARHALGIDHLVLAIHDVSFPSDADEEIGRGSPYSRGAERLIAFADALGFNGVQLGPQGVTSAGNRSPYDGTVFSRSPLSIAFEALAADGMLDPARLEEVVASAPAAKGLAHHEYAEAASACLLDAAFDSASAALQARVEAFEAASRPWLDHDADFEACAFTYGTDDPRQWPSADVPSSTRERRRFVFAQYVVHAQHAAFRARCRARGWSVFGDVQVGLSTRDRWRREALFLDRYAIGAPPSRTEPDGQPWGFAVLRPESSDASAFFRARVRKMASDYDALRIDHPHGLVCPWVYDRRGADPGAAVRAGARLFESPDLADHPALGPYAIARTDQIDRHCARYADGWVTSLDEAQVDRYAENVGVFLEELRSAGGSTVACEVLSTAPYPLVAVLRRFGLGRFRVTQKASLVDVHDGYRSENAEADDWIMVGTHDTPPLSVVVDGWIASGAAPARASYLAERIEPHPVRRAACAQRIAHDGGALVQAMTTDLFASPARHVVIFMADLFGLHERYNRPGIVSDDNWALRVPNDFEGIYRSNFARGRAMGVLGALAAALRASDATKGPHAGLADALDAAQSSLFAAPKD